MKQAVSAILFVGFLAGCSKSSGGGGNTTTTSTVTVSTLAGNGTAGYADGAAANAEFNYPWGLAIDSQKNVYVADNGNNRFRKISPAGIVTTFAGNGIIGYINATGTAAEFYGLNDLTTDAQGNLYVSDESNQRIRKITPQGVVTLVAGNGILGKLDGPAANAEFNGPSSVAIDVQGNIYVTDQFNNLIRKVTAAGVVSTLAGGAKGYKDATGTNAEFNGPNGIAVDAQGNVYVGDLGNNSIRKITPAGVVTTLAGNGTIGYVDGTGSNARFSGPIGLAIDAQGNIYVGDLNNNVIRKVTPAGAVTTLAGNGIAGHVDGISTNAEFKGPWGVAVDAQGNVYVADADNQCIRKITVQ